MPKQTNEPILIEMLVREPKLDSPIYIWDGEHACLRLMGIYHARPGLPADLAILSLERQTEVPVLLLHCLHLAPETRVQARLLGALTRQALLIIDESEADPTGTRRQCFALSTLSSAQLRYSLLGSALSIFVPQPDGHTRQVSLPFNSPAIAWFLPLFTRLLLNGPYYSD